MEQVISKTTITLAIQCFSTLKEIVQNSPQNQLSAAMSGILQAANRILLSDFRRKGDQGEDPDMYEKAMKLKLGIIEFLLELVADAEPAISAAIITHVRPKGTKMEKRSVFLTI